MGEGDFFVKIWPVKISTGTFVAIFLLSVIYILPSVWSSQKIEIISANRKFSSFEKYKKFRHKNSLQAPGQEAQASSPDSFASPQQELDAAYLSFISHEKNPEEFVFDPPKVKSVVLNSDGRAVAEAFAKVAPQTSVKKNIEEFAQKPSSRAAKPLNVLHDDVEGLLEKTAGAQAQPQLYLMDDKKLRIMSLTPDSAAGKGN